MEKPTMRMRASFSVTTKGVYTPDVTVEIDGVELSSEDLDKARLTTLGVLEQLHDDVCQLAESKGYTSSVIEQK